MERYRREQLLERIDREGATLGVDIPESIEVQGEELALREFVFEIRRQEGVPPADADRVDAAKRNLRRERLERKQRLEDADITVDEGERLAESIVGIDRALESLENLDRTDVEAAAKAQETADRKRWLSFLKEALGQNDDSKRQRGGR